MRTMWDEMELAQELEMVAAQLAWLAAQYDALVSAR